jgi:type 1 fimbriae regulatory protein FimB
MKTKGLQLTPEMLRALAQQMEANGGGSLEAPAHPQKRAAAKKKSNSTIKFLSAEQLARLFSVIRKHGPPRDLALFEVAFHRGLRASEVGLLTMGHLRLAARRLQVDRLKNGIGNEYVLTVRELKALKRWLAIRGEAAGPLFVSRNHGPIKRGRLDQMMKRYGRLAELPPDKCHFHVLRHSCGTELVEHDEDVLTIQDHLGHADIRNTAIYAKVSDKKRRQTGEKLAREW